MAISLRDRQRVADLIGREFRERHNEATRDPSELEVENAKEAIAAKLKIKPMIRELQAAEKKAEALRKKLSETVAAAKPPNMVMSGRSHRYGSCECPGDYKELLSDIAKHNVRTEIKQKGNRAEIDKTERRLLALVEVAASTDDLNKILKQAGLI